ncbi:hypothetical protein [Bacilliculturomica massiliensis]|uniref:hypothetical protein n=1 Tax=Bacilliculturomica massiliensis TaxID=1917867 RepID=UPI0010318226|nr:hypothetical protein [Bacilliculturomica massiliensis]
MAEVSGVGEYEEKIEISPKFVGKIGENHNLFLVLLILWKINTEKQAKSPLFMQNRDFFAIFTYAIGRGAGDRAAGQCRDAGPPDEYRDVRVSG